MVADTQRQKAMKQDTKQQHTAKDVQRAMMQQDVWMKLQDEASTLEVSKQTKALLKLYTDLAEVQDLANEVTAAIFGAESKEFEVIDQYLISCKNFLKKRITAEIFDNVFDSKSAAV